MSLCRRRAAGDPTAPWDVKEHLLVVETESHPPIGVLRDRERDYQRQRLSVLP
jgi:hypothetical protein